MPINFNVNCIFIFLREKISVYNKVHKIVQSHSNAQMHNRCVVNGILIWLEIIWLNSFSLFLFSIYFLHTEHSYLSKSGICDSEFHVKVKCGFAKSLAVFKLIKKKKNILPKLHWSISVECIDKCFWFISFQTSTVILFFFSQLNHFKVKCKQDGLRRT